MINVMWQTSANRVLVWQFIGDYTLNEYQNALMDHHLLTRHQDTPYTLVIDHSASDISPHSLKIAVHIFRNLLNHVEEVVLLGEVKKCKMLHKMVAALINIHNINIAFVPSWDALDVQDEQAFS